MAIEPVQPGIRNGLDAQQLESVPPDVVTALAEAGGPEEILSAVSSHLGRRLTFLTQQAAALPGNSSNDSACADPARSFPVTFGGLTLGWIISRTSDFEPRERGLICMAARLLAVSYWENEQAREVWDALFSLRPVAMSDIDLAFAYQTWGSSDQKAVYAMRLNLENIPHEPDEGSGWSDCSSVLGERLQHGPGPVSWAAWPRPPAATKSSCRWRPPSQVRERCILYRRGALLALIVRFVDVSAVTSTELRHTAEKVRRALSEAFGCEVSVGIGGSSAVNAEVPQLWRLAADTLRWGEALAGPGLTTDQDSLGILGLLINYVPSSQLKEYSHRQLRPLLEHDKEKGTELCRTLVAFVESGGNGMEASRRLYVHYNTLRARLRRIEELTGFDLSFPATRMNLAMCSQIYRLGSGRSN